MWPASSIVPFRLRFVEREAGYIVRRMMRWGTNIDDLQCDLICTMKRFLSMISGAVRDGLNDQLAIYHRPHLTALYYICGYLSNPTTVQTDDVHCQLQSIFQMHEFQLEICSGHV